MNWEYPSILTKEERKFLLASYEKCRPKKLNITGIVILYGTGGPIEPQGESLKDMFYTPENYNLTDEDTRNNTK